jgi:hypothetical protein
VGVATSYKGRKELWVLLRHIREDRNSLFEPDSLNIDSRTLEYFSLI